MPVKHPRYYPVLALVSLLGALCIVYITLQYSYSTFLVTASAGGFFLLSLSAVTLWWAGRLEIPAYVHAAVRLGILGGLLWVVEIGINNLIAPPVEIRDPIANLIWAGIAMLLLVFSGIGAYLGKSMRVGILTGLVGGTVSGLLACCTAVFLVTFGMPLLLHDPANLAEWAQQSTSSGAPSMAAYFAYQSLAGAFLHLIVLGTLMGLILGILGAAAGKFQARTQKQAGL